MLRLRRRRRALGTVEGTVTLDSQPLEGASVQFQPADGKRPSSAITDAQGRYSLMHLPDKPGAEIGKHNVRITAARTIEKAGKEVGLPERVPDKYNAKTTLVEEVKAGRNEINFTLTTGKGKK